MNLSPLRSVATYAVVTILQMVILATATPGQESPPRPASALTLDSIFSSQDFRGESFVGQWESDSQGFERIKRDEKTGNTSIIRIDLKDPTAEQVLVSSKMLTPAVPTSHWESTRTNGR